MDKIAFVGIDEGEYNTDNGNETINTALIPRRRRDSINLRYFKLGLYFVVFISCPERIKQEFK